MGIFKCFTKIVGCRSKRLLNLLANNKLLNYQAGF